MTKGEFLMLPTIFAAFHYVYFGHSRVLFYNF